MTILSNIKRHADRALYNNDSEYFIPIACHYDDSTLLTKNGELIQIIQINGINSEHISEKLFNLRSVVRNAIKSSMKSNNIAFWIHTVRRKTNLDDKTGYNKILSANIHDIWCDKNYWDDKFVNTLYMSIVYSGPDTRIKDKEEFAMSLSYKDIVNYNESYYAKAFEELNTSVEHMLECLTEYGAAKLGIRFEDEKCYSDPMFLYRRVVHLNDEGSLVPIADISSALASSRYAVGSDKIEVIDGATRKFASILSIKEYHEISSEALDLFLQLPVELVATEIFYFVDHHKVTSQFDHQASILKVSGDSMLEEIKGITEIMNNAKDADKRFCHQQISLMIIADSTEKLDEDVANASKELSQIGIVHVKEDITLEQTFWAQLPGNFRFLRRLAPTILENTGALASLHNFPTGSQYGVWGRAVTLLRTEKGTPYFFNFHDQTNKGNTCIIGAHEAGKTTLMNFLISEATKYDPNICYFTTKEDSKIFIDNIGGKWVSGVINPFLFEKTPDIMNFLIEFLKIICNHYVLELTDQEITFLMQLPEKILDLDKKDRNFEFIVNNIDFTGAGGDSIKLKLSAFANNPLYKDLFIENSDVNLSETDVIGINISTLTDKVYSTKFYPEDKKLLEKFQADLKFHGSVRFAVVYALIYYFNNISSKKKIFAIDNLETIVNFQYFTKALCQLVNMITSAKDVVVSTVDVDFIKQFSLTDCLPEWASNINTQIILPAEYKIVGLDQILGLTQFEIEKLFSFTESSRMFLIKQNNRSIAVELSIGGLIAITKILSCQSDALEVYKNVLQNNFEDLEARVKALYEALNNEF